MTNRIICDGHEYRVIEHSLIGGPNLQYRAINNYGSHVATATQSPCGEYWTFEAEPDANFEAADTYHASTLEGYSVPEQLVRWYAATT